ncbi:hypothetical protein EST38_g380 [Candolleomyces aberdarensis]|uniref:BTB domain-containing protein n=1 Tax=Candolleomyces aberdarensis TaxID=2316362 RepID=A0A4Q2E154_9AGAR|nr:hypothetical protein EST38_g380 [Candolleomyces aberdarensis]
MSCPPIASYDFDSPDADVVLLSSEPQSPAHFRVHRSILTIASPFFQDMFSLPQAPSTSTDESQKIPIIPVSETRDVLEPLLRFVYPVPDPIITTLDDLNQVLAAAIKYEFEVVVSTLRTFLLSPAFLQASPVKVYSIACQHDLVEEAKIASRHTLSTDLLDLEGVAVEELKRMAAYDYHKLLVLHKKRSEAALEFISKVDSCEDGAVKCMQCNGSVFTANGPPKWWIEWEKRAREELQARPTTDVVFGMDFLYAAARKGGCVRCPGSVLESWKILADLKEAIDSLPSTI